MYDTIAHYENGSVIMLVHIQGPTVHICAWPEWSTTSDRRESKPKMGQPSDLPRASLCLTVPGKRSLTKTLKLRCQCSTHLTYTLCRVYRCSFALLNPLLFILRPVASQLTAIAWAPLGPDLSPSFGWRVQRGRAVLQHPEFGDRGDFTGGSRMNCILPHGASAYFEHL